MITRLTPDDIPAFLYATGFFPGCGVMIETCLHLYGGDLFSDASVPPAECWLARDASGQPSAAIARRSGHLYCSADSNVDGAEFAAFAGAVGYAVAEMPEFLAAFFPEVDTSLSVVMEQRNPVVPASPIPEDRIATLSPREVYGMACSVMDWPLQDAAWSPWYVHLSLLLRQNRGCFYGISVDGQLAGCAGIYATGAQHQLIAGVITSPSYRRQGIAAGLVRYLCDHIHTAGKIPLLLCDPSLASYYKHLGFTAVDSLHRITAKS